jgi:hypothetical protein
VYKDDIYAAINISAMPHCCQLLQRLLWVLSCLSDDDRVYKDDMRAAGLPAALVSLFSVYQAHTSIAELRPLAAQMLRCAFRQLACLLAVSWGVRTCKRQHRCSGAPFAS